MDENKDLEKENNEKIEENTKNNENIEKETNAKKNDKKQKKEKPKDNRSFSEKLEDKLDDIMYSTQEFFYGESNNFTEDIPAMMEHPSEIKRINKVQTRRNLNKKILTTKGFKVVLKIIGVLFFLSILVSIITFICI